MELNGTDYEVPAMAASEWLRVLMDEELSINTLFLELVPAGPTILLDEGIDLDDLMDVGLGIIEEASGRPWYIAMRLIATMREHWNVLGAEMLYRGVDATQLSLAGWLDVALLVTLRTLDSKDVTMFVSRLELPPPGEEVPEEELEMSRDEFLSMMS
jgi:hypothetical protein